MKVLVLVSLLATSALGFPGYPPVKVRGKVGDNVVFDCVLKETVVEEFRTLGNRMDDLCKDFPSNIDTFDNIDLFVKIHEENSVDAFKKFAAKYGTKVKSLEWSKWGKYYPTFLVMKEVFDLLPNLEHFDSAGWRDPHPIEGEGIFNLPHLKSFVFEENDFDLLKTYVDYFPKNILEEFTVEITQNYSSNLLTKFLESQTKIEKVFVKGFILKENPFKNHKLHEFSYNFNLDRDSEHHKAFLKEFLKSQPELKKLNFTSHDLYHDYLDDSIFADITKLEHLDTLKFNFDGVSTAALKDLKNLKNLKYLTVQSDDKESTEKFDEFSKLSLPTLEKLTLKLGWGYDLPEKFYQQLAENFSNLKSLYLALGVTHPLNFFANTFPNLEALKITFGQSNNRIPFEKAYLDDSRKYEKLTTLGLEFTEKSNLDTELFFKMRNAFPNLENFDLSMKLPFEEKFLTKFYENLGKIKVLRLNSFEVPCNEAFDEEKIKAFKKFYENLDAVYFTLSNVVEFGSERGSCLFYENGKYELKEIKEKNTFSFKPFSETIKNDYFVFHDSYTTLNTFENLSILGGKKVETVDPYSFREL